MLMLMLLILLMMLRMRVLLMGLARDGCSLVASLLARCLRLRTRLVLGIVALTVAFFVHVLVGRLFVFVVVRVRVLLIVLLVFVSIQSE